MTCTTERDTDGTVTGITCTRGPLPSRDAAAVLAHFAEFGLIAEDAPTRPAHVAVTPPGAAPRLAAPRLYRAAYRGALDPATD